MKNGIWGAQATMRLAVVVIAVFTFSPAFGQAQGNGEDHCLDQFYGNVGPTDYRTTGKQAKIEGTFKLIMAMDKDGTSGHGFYLEGKEESSNETTNYTLVFGKNAPHDLPSGSKVVANGKLNGKVLSISSGTDSGGLQVTTQATVQAATGPYSVTVILVNFNDSTLAATPAQIQSMVNTNLTNFYSEVSNGKMSVSCTVKGPYTINYNGLGNCNYGSWASAADQAAGVSSGYRMYVLAPSGCGWGGLGMMPGNQTWVNGSYWSWAGVYPHEFGHNLGMHHATYNGSEYADHSCCMGNPNYPPHCNGAHKVQMGWQSSGTVANVSANGTYTYTLSALENNTTTTQVVEIPKPDTGDNYYISYRAPIGIDATNLESGYRNTTTVHHYSSGSTWTYLSSYLADGGTYSDSVNGITVTQTSHTASTATIQVVIHANVRPVASATATPSSGAAPLAVAFDGSASNDPDGSIIAYAWNFGVSPTVTASGVTASYTYTNPGTYYATLTVTDNSGAGNSTTITITVADPNAINAPSGLTAAVSSTTVTLTWNDNSNNETGFVLERGVKSGKGANATITWSSLASVGANTTTYANTGVTNGTYQYRVKAVNTATAHESAWSNTASATVGSTKGHK
ncbi:MAG: PKD domain-containing protein [Planctomycetes bacterium]|nr:PKD domain-containing protein [Planctomycetota bacterium]